MAREIDDVRRRIDLDEPDYARLAAVLGPEAVPQLLELVEDDDPAVASKATYVLSLIESPRSLEGVEAAAQSADANVRVAAAAALANVEPRDAEEVLRRLLGDRDAGVRKVALRSVRGPAGPTLLAEVERIARGDPEEALRAAATDSLRTLG
ncbi:MAG: HEAT repeat domain-containing protein [Actinomycetota bacterium]